MVLGTGRKRLMKNLLQSAMWCHYTLLGICITTCLIGMTTPPPTYWTTRIRAVEALEKVNWSDFAGFLSSTVDKHGFASGQKERIVDDLQSGAITWESPPSNSKIFAIKSDLDEILWMFPFEHNPFKDRNRTFGSIMALFLKDRFPYLAFPKVQRGNQFHEDLSGLARFFHNSRAVVQSFRANVAGYSLIGDDVKSSDLIFDVDVPRDAPLPDFAKMAEFANSRHEPGKYQRAFAHELASNGQPSRYEISV